MIKLIARRSRLFKLMAVIVLVAVGIIMIVTLTADKREEIPKQVEKDTENTISELENINNDIESTNNVSRQKKNLSEEEIEVTASWQKYRYPSYDNELLKEMDEGIHDSYLNDMDVINEFIDLYCEGDSDRLPAFRRNIEEVANDAIGKFYVAYSEDDTSVLLIQLNKISYKETEGLWQVTKYCDMSLDEYENAVFDVPVEDNPPVVRYNGQLYSLMNGFIEDQDRINQIREYILLGRITNHMDLSLFPEADFGSNFAPINSEIYYEDDAHICVVFEEDGVKKAFVGQLERSWGIGGGNASSIEDEVLSGKIVQLNLADSIDLDQDSKQEKITLNEEHSSDRNDSLYRYTITVNGKSMHGTGSNLIGELYAVSFDGKTIQLLIPENGPSADFSMYVYGYENDNLYYAGVLPGIPRGLGVEDGYVTASTEIYHLQCYCVRCDYELKNGAVVWKPRDFYEQGNTVSLKQDITLYEDKGTEKLGITLKEGSEAIILGSNLKEWVCIEDKLSGETGWLNVIDTTCTLPDGTEADSSDLFDGLYFYG